MRILTLLICLVSSFRLSVSLSPNSRLNLLWGIDYKRQRRHVHQEDDKDGIPMLKGVTYGLKGRTVVFNKLSPREGSYNSTDILNSKRYYHKGLSLEIPVSGPRDAGFSIELNNETSVYTNMNTLTRKYGGNIIIKYISASSDIPLQPEIVESMKNTDKPTRFTRHSRLADFQVFCNGKSYETASEALRNDQSAIVLVTIEVDTIRSPEFNWLKYNPKFFLLKLSPVIILVITILATMAYLVYIVATFDPPPRPGQ